MMLLVARNKGSRRKRHPWRRTASTMTIAFSFCHQLCCLTLDFVCANQLVSQLWR